MNNVNCVPKYCESCHQIHVLAKPCPVPADECKLCHASIKELEEKLGHRRWEKVGSVREAENVARADAAESKLSQLLAACEKFLKQTTGKSPEEIVAILNGGQQ